jgi:hypothetical protein
MSREFVISTQVKKRITYTLPAFNAIKSKFYLHLPCFANPGGQPLLFPPEVYPEEGDIIFTGESRLMLGTSIEGAVTAQPLRKIAPLIIKKVFFTIFLR